MNTLAKCCWRKTLPIFPPSQRKQSLSSQLSTLNFPRPTVSSCSIPVGRQVFPKAANWRMPIWCATATGTGNITTWSQSTTWLSMPAMALMYTRRVSIRHWRAVPPYTSFLRSYAWILCRSTNTWSANTSPIPSWPHRWAISLQRTSRTTPCCTSRWQARNWPVSLRLRAISCTTAMAPQKPPSSSLSILLQRKIRTCPSASLWTMCSFI